MIGYAEGVESQQHELRGGELQLTLFRIRRLKWKGPYGRRQLQGETTQSLIGPNYLVLSAERGAPTDPQLHLRKLTMVLVHRVPKGTELLELFAELHQLFC